jgi:pyruvate-ferredoxin/flavodoxin oxidoreductase
VQSNFEAVDQSLQNLHEVKVPKEITSESVIRPAVPAEAPEFVKNVLGKMISGKATACRSAPCP